VRAADTESLKQAATQRNGSNGNGQGALGQPAAALPQGPPRDRPLVAQPVSATRPSGAIATEGPR
jgi:hypothetical protein